MHGELGNMALNPWQAACSNPQRRWAYAGFVGGLALLTLLVFQSLPTAEPYALNPLQALKALPPHWALAVSFGCALMLWPPSRSLFAGRSKVAPFFRGALIGVAILLISAFITHFGHLIFEMTTKPNTEWGFLFGPFYFLAYLALPQAWLSLLLAALIGGLAFAVSEAVG